MKVDQLPSKPIFLGRGKPWYSKPGNVLLREIVESQQTAYAKATKQAEKTKIIRQVIKELQADGWTFIKIVSKSNRDWKYVDTDAVHNKVRHLFSDNMQASNKTPTKPVRTTHTGCSEHDSVESTISDREVSWSVSNDELDGNMDVESSIMELLFSQSEDDADPLSLDLSESSHFNPQTFELVEL